MNWITRYCFRRVQEHVNQHYADITCPYMTEPMTFEDEMEYVRIHTLKESLEQYTKKYIESK